MTALIQDTHNVAGLWRYGYHTAAHGPSYSQTAHGRTAPDQLQAGGGGNNQLEERSNDDAVAHAGKRQARPLPSEHPAQQ